MFRGSFGRPPPLPLPPDAIVGSPTSVGRSSQNDCELLGPLGGCSKPLPLPALTGTGGAE
jgi:hypothetical protein